MCIILFAWRHHPRYPLIVAANRDEFYDRPTAAADFWPGDAGMLAGKDLRCGGTWLGITRCGRFAAVTNYREGASRHAAPRSRGHLVSNYLTGEHTPAEYAADVSNRAAQYNGFNLLLGDRETLLCLSNREGGLQVLPPGVHGLSNHLLNTPWPKVVRGTAALRATLAETTVQPRSLTELLADKRMAEENELPETGIDIALERALSPILIHTPTYGTRSSTAIIVTQSGEVVFVEQSRSSGECLGPVHHQFAIEPPTGRVSRQGSGRRRP